MEHKDHKLDDSDTRVAVLLPYKLGCDIWSSLQAPQGLLQGCSYDMNDRFMKLTPSSTQSKYTHHRTLQKRAI